MKDVNGFTIKKGQRVYVRPRPCKMAPNAGPEALSGYPAFVLATDELLEVVVLMELGSCNRHDEPPTYISVQEGADKVELARRQVLGEEKPAKAGELTPSHKHFETYYKWQADMVPRKRGLGRVEAA